MVEQSRQRLTKWSVVLTIAIVTPLIVASQLEDDSASRLLLGVALVIAVGTSLGSAWQANPTWTLDRFIFSLGLGLAALVLGGLLLAAVHGLATPGWIAFEAAVVVGVPLLRRVGRGRHRAASPSRPPFAIVVRVFVATLLCTAIVVAALSIAVSSARQQTGPGFTALSFEGPSPGTKGSGLGLSVANRERISMTYRVEVLSGQTSLLTVAQFDLRAGQASSFAVPVDGLPAGTALTAALYRSGDIEPYRIISFILQG